MTPNGMLFAAGPLPVDLGESGHFTLLAYATITYPGSGTVIGDIGVHPGGGASILVPASQVTGTVYARDAGYTLGAAIIDDGLLNTAKLDLGTAYTYAAGLPAGVGPNLNPGLVPGHIGGMNLAPGIYTFDTGTDAYIDGADLTLTGGANDVWVFQMGRALFVEAGVNRSVILAGGAQAKNVFWQVGSSATLGTYSVFKGTIMAYASVILDVGSQLEGRALALNEQVVFNGLTANIPLATNATNLTLTIISEHGVGDLPAGLPPVGMVYTNDYGATLTNSITAVETLGGTQHVNLGWSMIGNDPASGATNAVTLTLTNNAVLTWLWNTNYALSLTALNGSISNTAAGWKPDGWGYDIYPIPDAGYVFDHWIVNGINFGTNAPLAGTMEEATDIIAVFRAAFIDVSTLVDWNVSWVCDKCKNYYIGTLTISNINAQKIIQPPIWFEVQHTSDNWLRSPTGVDTNTGLDYLDISTPVANQLLSTGNGDLSLDPGESVKITGIGLMGSGKPTSLVMAVWADPPAMAMPSYAVGVALEMPLPSPFSSAENVSIRGLPKGLTYSAATGKITGIPATTGAFTLELSADGVPKQTIMIGIGVLPTWAQGVFNGQVEGGGNASMAVSSRGKITGKLVIGDKTVTFSAASYAAGGNATTGFGVDTSVMSGRTPLSPLTLRVVKATAPAPATLSVVIGQINSGLPIVMYRNAWKQAHERLAPYVGYYTATLPGNESHGSSYLTFTVDKAGNVRTAGKLADGTAVSMSGTLILDEADRVWAVVYATPATYKAGRLSGIAEFVTAATGHVFLRPLDGGSFLWQNNNLQATPIYGSGFERELQLSGGRFDRLGNLYDYYRNKVLTVGTDADAPEPELRIGTVAYEADWLRPDGVALTIETNRYGVLTGIATAEEGAPAAENPARLKIRLARATGLFKGSFKARFDYTEAHLYTMRNVDFTGVLTPERQDEEDGFAGRGFFLLADKAQYVTPQNQNAQYKFNWSYDLIIMTSDETP